MEELAQSPATETTEIPSASVMPLPSTIMEWPADGSAPVSMATGQEDYEAPAAEPEPPESPEPPVAQEPETPQSDAPTEAPPVDLAALAANLTPEQIRELTKNNPALKRAFDGEVGSRLQKERAALVEQAKTEALAEYNEEAGRLQTAWDQLQEIEGWRDSDPEKYRNEVEYSPAVQQWKANLLAWRDRFDAKSKLKPRPAEAATPVDRNAVWAEWSNAGAEEAKAIIKASTEHWDQLPAENRKALESLAFSEGGNWLEDALKNYSAGTKAFYDKRMKEAVEAAREAGRNEALADRKDDSPVMVSSTAKSTLSAREILIEHMNNGLRNITREQLDMANREIGIAV